MLALLDARAPDASRAICIELGLHHEQQHQELILTDIKHLLSRNPLRPRTASSWPLHADPARGAAALDRASTGGLVEIGHDGAGFAFDNERPRHRVLARAASSSRSRPVDARRVPRVHRRRRLSAAGALALRRLGRGAARRAGARRSTGSGATARWRTFTLRGDAPVDPNAPVCHVSYYEADAFARWAGARLPTEAEWEARRARRAVASGNFARERRAASAGAARGAARRRARAAVRRRLGMDAQRLRALPGLPARRRRARRIQRQVHVQPVRAARRLVRHAARATSARPTATSFRPRRAGSSPACGWRATRASYSAVAPDAATARPTSGLRH